MDSFEINKIIAAVLLTALIIIGIGKFTDILFHVEKPKESAYKIEGLEVAATNASAGSAEAKVVEAVDIKALLAMGDLAHGEKVFKKCTACHQIAAGGKNMIGKIILLEVLILEQMQEKFQANQLCIVTCILYQEDKAM